MPRRKILTRRPARPSLRVRLVAVAVCLLAAGAGIIVVAGVSATRSQLTRQAEQQLRAYAGQLTSRPFLLTPFSRSAPGAPELSDLAAGTSAVSIEVRGSGGQLVLRTGPDHPAGPGLHAAAAQVLASRARARRGPACPARQLSGHRRADPLPGAPYPLRLQRRGLRPPRHQPGRDRLPGHPRGERQPGPHRPGHRPPRCHPAGHERPRAAGHRMPGRLGDPRPAPPGPGGTGTERRG